MKSLIDQRGDIHHIFPKKYLQKCGIKESGMYNQIANYVYTQSEINIKVKDQAPKEYMAQVKEQCTGVNAVCGGIDSFFMATIDRLRFYGVFIVKQNWARDIIG